MDSSTPMQPPEWVKKRDGRIEPFDADKINQALFAAADRLGRPDAFIARELADSVLHFLAREADGPTTTTAQIQETLVKVLRELDQPQIAQAMVEFRRTRDRAAHAASQEQPVSSHQLGVSSACIWEAIHTGDRPDALVRQCGRQALEAFSLSAIYTPNLAAAHREGLLVLEGLSQPLELSAAALRLPWPATMLHGRGLGVFEAVEQVRNVVGEVLPLDAPERELAQRGARVTEAAAFVRELGLAARTLHLQIVLNLNRKQGPAWAEELAEGPLFAPLHGPDRHERLLGLLDALVDQTATQPGTFPIRVGWHLAEEDFEDELSRQRLVRVVRAALSGSAITFVFERPRRPALLADGLDRQRPALLQWVGLDLLRLAERKPLEGLAGGVQSLARLAQSAGAQKRQFLREHVRRERPSFLFEKAHVGLYLIGLPALLRQRFGGDDNEEALAFVQQILRQLQEPLAGSGMHQECVVDELLEEGKDASCWLAPIPPGAEDWKARFRLAGRLHGTVGRGTLRLGPSDDQPLSAAELVERLHFAWRQTNLARVCLWRPPARQLTAPWNTA